MGNFNIIAASGTNQATAAVIPAEGQIFSVDVLSVPAGSGIRLHEYAYNFAACLVRNSGSNALLVYPPPNGTIDRVPTPKSVLSEGLLELWAFSRLDWVSMESGSGPPPFDAPAFTSFAISGQATTLEIGDSVSSGSHTFTWSTSNPTNVTANSIGITDTTALVVLASGLADDGTESITLSAITNTTPGVTQIWTIHATDTQSTTFSRTFTVTWLARIHAGDSASLTLNGAAILALALNPFKATPAGDYAIAGTNYKFFCHPDSMGDITAIVDPDSGGMPIALDQASPYTNTTASGLTYALVSVTNGFGVTMNYRVFKSTYILGGTVTFRVS